MDKNSNSFVMTFAVGMCVVLAVLLSGTFNLLKDKVDANERFDREVNVLIATGLHSRAADAPARTRAELEELYEQYIDGKVLEVKREVVDQQVKEGGVEKTVQVEKVVDMVETEYAVAELPALRLQESRKPDPADRREFVEFYTRYDEAEAGGSRSPLAYCIPIEGLGLWGMIYGYLALEPDIDTVKGITFYKHKETPGLGGEIDKEWWQSQWPGKEIFNDAGDLVSVTVKKGKVDPSIEVEREHYVDGLSGATITSNGVTRFVEEDLRAYMPYLEDLRQE